MIIWFIGALVFKLLVLAAVALGICKLVIFLDRERRRRDSSERGGSRRAVGILRERFASGEIDEAEYRERLEVLRPS